MTECGICNMSMHPNHLKRHQLTHTGQKNYICQVCGKKCSRADNLRIHIKTVHRGHETQNRIDNLWNKQS